MSEDKISILVNSKDPLLMDLFNLPIISRQIGIRSEASNNQGMSGYTINKDGNIDFPVLGHIHVAGMTREEIALCIKEELISKNLVKDPVVTVEFMNLTVSVLGEVANPGRFNIDKDRLTLLDALSMAGDLTVYIGKSCGGIDIDSCCIHFFKKFLSICIISCDDRLGMSGVIAVDICDWSFLKRDGNPNITD